MRVVIVMKEAETILKDCLGINEIMHGALGTAHLIPRQSSGRPRQRVVLFLVTVMAVRPRRDTRSVLRSGVDGWEERRGGWVSGFSLHKRSTTA